MDCARCKRLLVEIDRYGEQLIGCLECNCWRASKSAFIVDLSVEKIQALRDNRQTHTIRRET
jgi:hypothetical protein